MPWTGAMGPGLLGTRTNTKRLYSDGRSDFSNGYLVTHFYSGSTVMLPYRPSLLWPSVATILGDITSSPVATMTIQ
jgi:hypothetical protein